MRAHLRPDTSKLFSQAHGPHWAPHPQGHGRVGATQVASPKRGQDQGMPSKTKAAGEGQKGSRPQSQVGTPGIATALPPAQAAEGTAGVTPQPMARVGTLHLTKRAKGAARCQALPNSLGYLNASGERQGGLRTAQLGAGMAAAPQLRRAGSHGAALARGFGDGDHN